VTLPCYLLPVHISAVDQNCPIEHAVMNQQNISHNLKQNNLSLITVGTVN